MEITTNGGRWGLTSLLFSLRVQILVCAFLWPVSGWLFQTALIRGLGDTTSYQVALVSIFAGLLSTYLAVTANLVLLWGKVRQDGARTTVIPIPGLLLKVRIGVSLLSLAFCVAFLMGVRTRSDAPYFWFAAISGVYLSVLCVFILEELGQAIRPRSPAYRLLPLPIPFVDDHFRLAAQIRARMAIPHLTIPPKVRRWLRRARRRWLHMMDWALGPGFLNYRGERPEALLPGHLIPVALFVLLLLQFYDQGDQFLHPAAMMYRFRLIAPSSLSLALSGASCFIAVLAFLTYYFDRLRVPVTLVVAAWVTVCAWTNGTDHSFWSEPARSDKLSAALTPSQVMARAPSRFIAVAAAGGGIQASGWTAQVLSGLLDEDGDAFRKGLRVMSGVSGGAVGAMFFAGTYDGVWGKSAYSAEECRRRAMASSMNAVAWGLAFPDLHRAVVPMPFLHWDDLDRGWSLERALAEAAGRYPGPSLLSLAPLVAQGVPVLLINATLTADALPIVFTNGRFPDPETSVANRRGIRSFHDDLRMDTHLETATRLSATFPVVSPAARPGELKSRNTFVDGGYFDNSGLYSLMSWLEQGVAKAEGGETKEVMVIQTEAFPEVAEPADKATQFAWYRQLTLPIETVIGVRGSGQAMRNHFEFPMFAKSLDGRLKVRTITFRFHPSPRCSLEAPPLSWHLTKFEQDCIREGWDEKTVREGRQELKDWLNGQ